MFSEDTSDSRSSASCEASQFRFKSAEPKASRLSFAEATNINFGRDLNPEFDKGAEERFSFL